MLESKEVRKACGMYGLQFSCMIQNPGKSWHKQAHWPLLNLACPNLLAHLSITYPPIVEPTLGNAILESS